MIPNLSSILEAIDKSDALVISNCLSGDLIKAGYWRDHSDKLHTKAWNSSKEYRDYLNKRYGNES